METIAEQPRKFIIVIVIMVGSLFNSGCQSKQEKLTSAIETEEEAYYKQTGSCVPLSPENLNSMMQRIGAEPNEAAFVQAEMVKYYKAYEKEIERLRGVAEANRPAVGVPGWERYQTPEEQLEGYRLEQEHRNRLRQIDEEQRRWEEEKRRMDARTYGNPYGY